MQCCRSCLLLLSPASTASMAFPGLSAHSHLFPTAPFTRFPLDLFVLRCPVCQHVCGAELLQLGKELVLPVPSTAPLPQGVVEPLEMALRLYINLAVAQSAMVQGQ